MMIKYAEMSLFVVFFLASLLFYFVSFSLFFYFLFCVFVWILGYSQLEFSSYVTHFYKK